MTLKKIFHHTLIVAIIFLSGFFCIPFTFVPGEVCEILIWWPVAVSVWVVFKKGNDYLVSIFLSFLILSLLKFDFSVNLSFLLPAIIVFSLGNTFSAYLGAYGIKKYVLTQNTDFFKPDNLISFCLFACLVPAFIGTVFETPGLILVYSDFDYLLLMKIMVWQNSPKP